MVPHRARVRPALLCVPSHASVAAALSAKKLVELGALEVGAYVTHAEFPQVGRCLRASAGR
jgi:hypothetical protein